MRRRGGKREGGGRIGTRSARHGENGKKEQKFIFVGFV
jgi:hypothetical protein